MRKSGKSRLVVVVGAMVSPSSTSINHMEPLAAEQPSLAFRERSVCRGSPGFEIQATNLDLTK